MRTCPREGCEREATHVAGYYVARLNRRRVRLWLCVVHYMAEGMPTGEMDRPATLARIEDAELREREKIAQKARIYIIGEPSVPEMRSSGHGEPVRFDRVAAWRHDTIRTYVL